MRNIVKKIILLSIALLLFAPVARLHAEDQPDLLELPVKDWLMYQSLKHI